MKQALNRASVVFAFVLMFFSFSAVADPIEDAFNAGKQECINNPGACGITEANPNAITEAGKNAGKQICIDNPGACGITLTDTNGSREEGINFCRKNPSACQIKVNYYPILQNEAKFFCQMNPTFCLTENFLNSLINEGKDICTRDPKTCFTYINQNPNNEVVPEDFCDNKTKNCYSNKYGFYFNAVHAAESIDELGNLNAMLEDIAMDVLFNDKDTLLFIIKLDYLQKKLDETHRKKTLK